MWQGSRAPPPSNLAAKLARIPLSPGLRGLLQKGIPNRLYERAGLVPARLLRESTMKRVCSDKDINQLIKELLQNGWRYQSGKKHGKIELPGVGKVVIPTSPSDRRTLQNLIRDIRQLERRRPLLHNTPAYPSHLEIIRSLARAFDTKGSDKWIDDHAGKWDFDYRAIPVATDKVVYEPLSRYVGGFWARCSRLVKQILQNIQLVCREPEPRGFFSNRGLKNSLESPIQRLWS